MYADSHLHTAFSGDSETPPAAQIEQAIRLGMKTLCITDHQDFDYPPCESEFLFDTASYFEKLSILKDYYSSQIDLRIGVELGLQPKPLSVDLPSYAAAWPFDFIIGSTHVCSGKDPYYPDFYEGRTESEAYQAYFEDELKNVQMYDCFDSAGHLDYVVRYGPSRNRDYSYHAYADILDEILKTLISKEKAIECNTAGFKAGLGHPHPTEDVLRRYRELGGELLTLGSDAHQTEHLGYEFRKTGELLKSLGFRYYTIYRNRRPEFLPL